MTNYFLSLNVASYLAESWTSRGNHNWSLHRSSHLVSFRHLPVSPCIFFGQIVSNHCGGDKVHIGVMDSIRFALMHMFWFLSGVTVTRHKLQHPTRHCQMPSLGARAISIPQDCSWAGGFGASSVFSSLLLSWGPTHYLHGHASSGSAFSSGFIILLNRNISFWVTVYADL